MAECPLQQRRPLARSRRCWWKRGTLPPAQRREKWPWKPTKQGWRGRALKNLPGCCGTTAALEPGYGCRSVLIRCLSPLDQRLSEICQTIRFMPKLFTVGYVHLISGCLRFVLLILPNSTRTKTCFEDPRQRSCTMLLRMKIMKISSFNDLVHDAFSSERNAHVFLGKKLTFFPILLSRKRRTKIKK